MPPEPRRVLLSDATSYKAVVLARFLKQHHPRVEVLTCDSRPASRLFHTRYSDRHWVLRSGPGEPASFVEGLAELVHEARVDLLIPVNSREMDALVPVANRFGTALAYWGDHRSYLTLHRKDRLHALAQSLAITVPARFDTAAAVRVPAVAKPVALSSAKGVRYLRDRADVERFLRVANWADFVVQAHVPGEGVGYSVFARGGRVLVGYAHRRLAEFPPSGGSSVYREGWDDARARDVAERLIAASGWSGFAMFEFKRTPQNELFLLEANPRVWGSIQQPLACGVDVLEPLLGTAALLPEPQARTYLPPLVHASLLAAAARGRVAPLLDFLRHARRNRADVSLLRDPRGYLGALTRALV